MSLVKKDVGGGYIEYIVEKRAMGESLFRTWKHVLTNINKSRWSQLLADQGAYHQLEAGSHFTKGLDREEWEMSGGEVPTAL